ncbi:ATP synthase complex subunit H-domain-containing protein [Irpex rosettiformis]|uniref:ATP synthase complex subunit H-domain-containing protein n=1 Tax=Irpex rosettiformis TaxID=378272 RepID=A0ACB8TQU1_9APHY|nr:ATP synthase complex subunit H-domain-containing protein [Irpex rosettiformis]
MSSAILRQASGAIRAVSRSTAFSTSAIARKDFVQDLYIRELKSYKPAPIAKDAHLGAVKAYTLPPKPQAPAAPTDLASELAAYDASEPTKADVKVEAAPAEHTGQGPEAFLDMLEADIPEDNHHH